MLNRKDIHTRCEHTALHRHPEVLRGMGVPATN